MAGGSLRCAVPDVSRDITFASPAEPVGHLVDRLFLARYLRRLVEVRNEWLKRALEDGRQ
ncbi:hypothetical protein [Nocardioides sp.]|uniref:hypothetical protein n=1 Tax=Nocardioides sp. TaxID=35761 RepID=UPI002B6E2B11|nr:hypothetical protein [Nocardioides sp.]HXH81221.1 hypothetical protein [Nocardioides sp.]